MMQYTGNHSFKSCADLIIFEIKPYWIELNWIDLQALTLVGPPRQDPVLEPLAVQHLDNQLYIMNLI